MSDLVERVARAIYEADDPWHKAWPWPDLQSDQAGVDQYRRIAKAAIAAMQTDAAPALKPAVEVADSIVSSANVTTCDGYYEVDIDAAAAVIEADRAAIIAAKDAEIAALQAHADALAGELSFAANRLDRLSADYVARRDYAGIAITDWIDEIRQALRAYEEFRRG